MKVLVADDDPIHRRILRATLSGWGYDVVETGDGAIALDLLETDLSIRLALLDWMMPQRDGPEVCQAMRERRRDDHYVYTVLLTSRASRDDLVTGLDAGADDYLIKPFDPPELQARLNCGKRLVRLHEQLVETREELRRLATRDALTGLWNRTAIHDILARELVRAECENRPVGLVMLDLDHFKRINDTQGHLVGDAVLAETGRRMLNGIRPYDTIGRYGGEEFLVVLPNCDQVRTNGIAERLRGLLAEAPVDRCSITASVGWVIYPGQGKAEGNRLLQSADEAMYEAKRMGRNRVVEGRLQ